MTTKKSFENLTVVSVTGCDKYIEGSIYAIARSCEHPPGAKGLLISPNLPEGITLPENITHRKIAPFSYLEYNLFILYQLDYYIDTDYCLIVQEDGFVVNGKNWRDEFWDYDYIGAPIPHYSYFQNGKLNVKGTDFYFKHPEYLHDPNYIEPQNGGFSLRSKRILGMPRKLYLEENIAFTILPPKAVTVEEIETSHKMQSSPVIHNEDIFLSVMHRRLLEHKGIKFAPSKVATFFSLESDFIPDLRGVKIEEIMGMHLRGMKKKGELLEDRVELAMSDQYSHYTKEMFIEKVSNIRLLLINGIKVDILVRR